jgi:putative FmdB family regulatory protein
MPTYDYLCPNGHRFEVIHSVTAEGPSICPICGAAPVRKAFTAPTIHFKGTGWAKKDRSSTSRSSTHAASADGGFDSGSGSGSGSSSDLGSGSGDGVGTGSGSGSDKRDGASPDNSTRADVKKAPDKGSSSETAKPKGSSSSSRPAAGD